MKIIERILVKIPYLKSRYLEWKELRNRRNRYYEEFDKKHGKFTHKEMLPLYVTWIVAFSSFPIGILTGATAKDVLIIFYSILLLSLITMPNKEGR